MWRFRQTHVHLSESSGFTQGSLWIHIGWCIITSDSGQSLVAGHCWPTIRVLYGVFLTSFYVCSTYASKCAPTRCSHHMNEVLLFNGRIIDNNPA